MKKLIMKIDNFLCKELPWWVSCILVVLLMIVPSCYAASKGITSFGSYFFYGVLYGVGLCFSLDGIFRYYEKKKKAAYQEKTGH